MAMRRSLARLAGLTLSIAACSSSTGAPAADDQQDAVWRTTPLVDARSGETFAINDLRGKLVAVEPMAIWCSNCQIQQLEAAVALKQLASPDIVYISLDVDPNEQPDALAKYADGREFGWRFAVAGTEVARSLAAAFGDQILSPPSTPLILIGPDGSVVSQDFGIRGSGNLVDLFGAHLP